MKKIIFLSLSIIQYTIIHCQSVGIGTSTPDASAQLEISSTTKGFLLPRMNTSQRDAIVNPVAGLQVFNIDKQSTDTYDGSSWTKTAALRLVGASADAAHGVSNSWTQKADFGGDSVNAAVGFSINGKGYIGTGYRGNSVYRKDFWEYDPATDSWTQKADFGGAARYYAVGFAMGSKGYIGTGANDSQFFKDFWEYDPYTNIWLQKADFGGTARIYAVGFSLFNLYPFPGVRAYIGTGTDASPQVYKNDFWEYEPYTDTWTQKASFGGGLRTGATGFSISGLSDKGYIGLGLTNGTHQNDFWEFDPTNLSFPGSGVWTQKADFGGEARTLAVGFSLQDGKGYMGLGYNSVENKNDFWQYDVYTNLWTKKADFPGTPRQASVAFGIGSKGYIATGSSGTGIGSYTKELWEYMDDNQVYSYTSNAISSTNSVSDGAWTLQNNIVYNSNFGKVGIGTPEPAYTLDINGTAHCTAGAWSSDARFKNNISNISYGLKDVMLLRPVSYNWNADKQKDDGMKGEQLGFIAQEMEKVLPLTVLTDHNAMQSKSIKYNELIPILTKAIQEQQQKIVLMEKKIEELKQLVNKLTNN